MTTFHHAERAARLLRSARARIRPHRFADPSAAVAIISETLARVTVRRRRRRTAMVFGLAAAAGVSALAVLLPWPVERPAPAPRPIASSLPKLVVGNGAGARLATVNGIEPLQPGHAWRSEERLQTQAWPVTLAAGGGSTVEIAPRSDLKLLRADNEQWLRLGGGSVAVHVAKLTAGQRFVVVTPDAEVEVRGTRFQVALAAPVDSCGHGTRTRVAVDEGVVVVRSGEGEARVPAGQSWPAPCPAPQLAPPPVAPPRSIVTKRARKPETKPLPSTLATENDLFSAALSAERAGDRAGAARLFDVLLSRFPHSPLKESAERARTRLVTATSPAP